MRLPLVESVLPSNDAHLERAVQRTLELSGEKIGVYVLAYKEDTDDLRESLAIVMLERLLNKGRAWRANVRLDAIRRRPEPAVHGIAPHWSANGGHRG